MTNFDIPAKIMTTIEPLIERAATARSAAAYHTKRIDQCAEVGDINGGTAHQNEAIKYSIEETNLLGEARQICRAAGCSLPGWKNGLLAIADNYSARLDRKGR